MMETAITILEGVAWATALGLLGLGVMQVIKNVRPGGRRLHYQIVAASARKPTEQNDVGEKEG